jgi:hypothetical protein
MSLLAWGAMASVHAQSAIPPGKFNLWLAEQPIPEAPLFQARIAGVASYKNYKATATLAFACRTDGGRVWADLVVDPKTIGFDADPYEGPDATAGGLIVLTSGSDDDSLVRAYSTNLPPVAQTQSQTARAHGAPSFGQAEVEIVRDGNRREIVSFVKGSRIRSTVGETPGPGQVEGKAAAARDAALAELPAGGLTPVEGSRTDAVGTIPKAVDVP